MSTQWEIDLILNPSQDGGEGSPTSFSPATSTNVGIRPQNLLTFIINPFDKLVQNFKFVASASPNY